MENEKHINLEAICNHYKIETSFIHSLNDYGLVEITLIDEVECIDKEYLNDIERIMTLHYELNINLEGVDAIQHLLKRVNQMQTELQALRNRLGID